MAVEQANWIGLKKPLLDRIASTLETHGVKYQRHGKRLGQIVAIDIPDEVYAEITAYVTEISDREMEEWDLQCELEDEEEEKRNAEKKGK